VFSPALAFPLKKPTPPTFRTCKPTIANIIPCPTPELPSMISIQIQRQTKPNQNQNYSKKSPGISPINQSIQPINPKNYIQKHRGKEREGIIIIVIITHNLNNQVKTAQKTRPGINPQPKDHIPQRLPPLQKSRATGIDKRNLRHLHNEQVPTQALEQTPHDQLVHESTKQEGDHGSGAAGNMPGGDAAMVDVPEEEAVHGLIPVAGKSIPGRGIPPGAVEAAVGEEGEFGEDVED